MGKIVGRDIITDAVALVYRGPQLAGLLIDSNAYCIPQAACTESQFSAAEMCVNKKSL